jgi:tryptophanyl-tRNA synthetase
MSEVGVKEYDDELVKHTSVGDYKHFFHRDSGVIKSSRDLYKFLDHYTKYGPDKCYIYTGRGPSSADMHLGHMIPFMVTRELQRALNVRVVIQLTDDEKFLFRGEHSLNTYQEFAKHNKVLIQKCGLDPQLTDIYIDTEDIARFYPTMLKLQSKINFSQVRAVFGLKESDSIGKIGFPALEMAPCDPRCLFPADQAQHMRCLVVCAWDQDSFFRLVRDHAKTLKFSKPSLLHLNYLPALNGKEKMSTTGPVSNYSIWLSDTPDQVKNKIKRSAFSGGGLSAAEQEKFGANIDVDVSCKYLKFFLKDRAMLRDIVEKYRNGKIDTKDVKDLTITVVNEIIDPY